MYYYTFKMAKLLKTALDKQMYELAAHILVFGLIKAKQDDKKRLAKRQKARILQQGAG